MVGLRGVGKTVLLGRMRDDAEESGIQVALVEAPRNALCLRSLGRSSATRCSGCRG